MKPGIIGILISMISLMRCYNYGLDDRIKNALGNGSSSNSSNNIPIRITSFSGGTFDGSGIQYTLSNLTKFSGSLTADAGKAPYTYTMDTANMPGYLLATIDSSNNLSVGKNLVNPPPNVAPSAIAFSNVGNLVIRVSDAGGSSGMLTINLSVSFKRAFVTSGTAFGDMATSSSGSFLQCTGSGYSRADCACQKAAQNANLVNFARFHVYLSSTNHAGRCNIANKTGNSCTTNPNEGGPWYRTDGPFMWADMSTGTNGLFSASGLPAGASPLQKTETGATYSGSFVWSATTVAGNWTASNDCSGDWVSTAGNGAEGDPTAALGANWINNGSFQACNTSGMAVYCFEADF